jgi:Leucine-rich repeat (LRR) protein
MLKSLDLSGCSSLEQLPDTIGHLTALTSLYLSDCSSLQQLPGIMAS